ncbi:MAG: leucyl aminopeptidase [Tissierellia bacterium]|nr:leucyl aminopeptidase [Tissierellia bacterium]
MKFNLNSASGVKVFPLSIEAYEKSSYFDRMKNLFNAKSGEVFPNFVNGDLELLLGLGKEKEISTQEIIKAFYSLGKAANEYKISALSIDVSVLSSYFPSIIEGLYQSKYRNEKYLSDRKEQVLLDINFTNAPNSAQNTIDMLESIMEGVFLARNLINEPAMYLYPETLAQRALDKLEPAGVKVEILNKKDIEELGMEAFLSVAKGSAKEPKLIIMTYKGDEKNSHVTGLVGKGLTYDSGGYCIKPPSGMKTMHSDMGGAGTVIGAIYSIAKSKLKCNITGVVAACENMISGDAYKTGDIIGSMSGKTIEIDNTDAEGRVTLADSLYYTATKLGVNEIIDLATLTGACVVALGDVATGAITNNQLLLDKLVESGNDCGEPIWQLPSFPEYKELIKSSVADLKNSGGRYGGTITAGLFLQEFVNELPWVHLDIAGTSFLEKPRGYLPLGATGFGVKTLFNYFAK